jgi:hypothetical protein
MGLSIWTELGGFGEGVVEGVGMLSCGDLDFEGAREAG